VSESCPINALVSKDSSFSILSVEELGLDLLLC
jgi:hypothetical protein